MRNQKGFTLIEAAVAIAVVAILSGIIVPLVVKNISDAQTARAKNDVQVIAGALAAQYKDFGSRPQYLGGGWANAAGDAYWSSGSGTQSPSVVATAGYQTFLQLFAGMNANAPYTTAATAVAENAGWGTTVGGEFSWKGPYLSWDVANKSNPWGGKYYIFGYDANGQAGNTPIWVVCPGPDNKIDTTVNPVATAVGLPQQWTTVSAAGTSADDIAVRVN
jgi:prepilin-type N-terminal cleavage/methylation domain-containing protein